MTQTAVQVWNNILDVVKTSLIVEDFKRWFSPIRPLKLENNALTIEVPNEFVIERLETNYLDLLKKCIKKELGDKGKLEYQFTYKEIHKPGHPKLSNSARGTAGFQAPPPAAEFNPFVIPGIQKIKVDPNLSNQYSFDNFIEGNCNRMARQAGLSISKEPGQAFNPLILYGDVGLGKTHLMHAIGNKLVENFPTKNILYLSAEKFINQFIISVKNNSTYEFSNFYQNLDVLMIDDIQFFANKSGTQEIFFHLFNHLHQNKKQIVLTSDKAPSDLKDIEDRLLNRFKWSLTADLTTPDYETRMAILLSKCEQMRISLPDRVMDFICHNLKSNIREMEGVLVALAAQASINKKQIDLDLTKEVMRSYLAHISTEVTVEEIIQLVSEHLKISVEQIQGKSRKSNIMQARHISIYFSKKFAANKSLKAIGEFFGGKDHSTVLHSCKVVTDAMDIDKSYKDNMDQLEKKITKRLRIK